MNCCRLLCWYFHCFWFPAAQHVLTLCSPMLHRLVPRLTWHPSVIRGVNSLCQELVTKVSRGQQNCKKVSNSGQANEKAVRSAEFGMRKGRQGTGRIRLHCI